MNARCETAAPPSGRRGFTLIEVLVVVVIIGIAGALVVPSLLSAGSLSIQGASRLLIADFLYAQNEAVAAHSEHHIIFELDADGTNQYGLFDADGQVLHSAWVGGDYIMDFASDSRFSNVQMEAVDFGGATSVTFDELGAPSSGGYVDLTDGQRNYRVSVAPFTGRVTVAPK